MPDTPLSKVLPPGDTPKTNCVHAMCYDKFDCATVTVPIFNVYRNGYPLVLTVFHTHGSTIHSTDASVESNCEETMQHWLSIETATMKIAFLFSRLPFDGRSGCVRCAVVRTSNRFKYYTSPTYK